MRFFHLADLHLGKKINEFDLLPDQKLALDCVIEQARARRPHAVLIAGDVYDRAIPPAEAVTLLSEFLSELIGLGVRVCMIGGNHDSQERLAFGKQILEKQGLYVAGAYDGSLKRVGIRDEYGAVDFWLIPFFRPREVGEDSYHAAVKRVISRENIDFAARNVALCHQFVTSAGEASVCSDSELPIGSIGGTDNVDASVFEGFCYAALGHLHGAQRVGKDSVRYAGSPVKYSFSEARQKKSFVIGEIGREGDCAYTLFPYPFLHDMREIRGTLAQLTAPEAMNAADPLDYLHVTLTDAVLPMMPRDRLALCYPNLMKLDIERPREEEDAGVEVGLRVSPFERFEAFFQTVNGKNMTADELEWAREVFRAVLEGEQ